MFKLTTTDMARMKGVHPDLVRVIVEAAKTAKTPFRVLEGLRTTAKQQEYFRKGTSRLDGVKKKSKHQIGKAVDIVPIVNGKVEFRSWAPFHPMAANVKAAAKKLGVRITWGGDWKSFPDGPHFELP
jgi:peptidoglycan L-alanyl-D-glutamate endopeptidase CwlK